ncbi:MAG: YdeI/OmpD-associated family protein [Acidobacteriota bacterium]
MKDMPELLSFPDRSSWRAWLEKNHRSGPGIWLAFYKKATGKPTVVHEEAIEEALCFGWIDGIIRRIDDARFAVRFMPRARKTHWSAKNIERAKKLVRDGRMTPAGLARFEGATVRLSPASRPGLALSPELAAQLRAHPKAAGHFDKLTPSRRRLYVGWIMSAKKEETRRRRLSEAVARLERGLLLGMK